MSYAKSFLVSIIALIILNSLVFVLAYVVSGNFDGFIAGIVSNPIHILYVMFSSTGIAIWVLIERIVYAVEDPFMLLTFVLYLGLILSPLIASILTGRMSEKRIHALVGFLLSTIICMLVCLILVFSGFAYQIQIGASFSQSEALMNVVLGSLVNGVIYGLVAFATSKN